MENEDVLIVDDLPEETQADLVVSEITIEQMPQEEETVPDIVITGVDQYEGVEPSSEQTIQQDVLLDNDDPVGDASEQILLLRAINANLERLLETESETDLVEPETETEIESETDLIEMFKNYERALDSISDMTALTVDDLVYMIDQQNKIAKSQQMLLTAIMITCALCFGAICVLVIARYLHS